MTPLDALVAAADAYLAQDRSQLSGSAASESLVILSGVVGRLEGAQVELTGQVETSGVWALDGSRSATSWLVTQTRATRAVAGSQLKLARALRELLPLTAGAVLVGTVPLGHARLIARTCTRTQTMRDLLSCPDVGETLLLDHAHLNADDFARYCQAWAYRADPDAADAAYREDRDGFELRLADTSHGTVPGGLFDPVVAEMIRTVLRAEIGVPAATDTRSTGQRMHDALGSVLARALSGGGLGKTHGVRPQIVVHVPLATATAAPGTPGLPPAWLQDSQAPIPTCVLDRIACDSEVLRAVMSTDGEVLEFGRAKRLFEGPLRRALETRDGGCRYPGCQTHASQCEGHHLRRWIDGGLTNIDEGALLCWFHHTHVHSHRIRIEKVAGGGLAFVTRHGEPIGTTYPHSGPDPDPLPWPEDPRAGHARRAKTRHDEDCRGPT